MNKTARFVLKTVAAGLAFCAFVCLVVGSWSDVYEAIERRRACRLSKQESRDYADEELYQKKSWQMKRAAHGFPCAAQRVEKVFSPR